jgi:hypothetical protein
MTKFPTEVKFILERVLESPRFRNKWAEHLVQSKWESWVGKKIVQHIRPKNLKGDQLTVIIDDERWANSFDGFKDKILENMEKDLDSLPVKGFTVIIDKKKQGQKVQKKGIKEKAKNKNVSKVQSSRPTQSLNKEMKKDLNHIKDPGIRDALKRLIIKDLSSKDK